jgi:hypothetical protein
MPNASQTADRLRPRADLGIEQIDGDLLILDKQNQKIHQLNSTASFIWAGLDEGQETVGIAEHIVELFGVSPETALRDVNGALQQFCALNLLEKTGT